ncbi:MAG: sialate O-acetylesterase [Planctomycetia bacterium]|nr:sialate O-acetylesterase [Planctomycetia bacterium]
MLRRLLMVAVLSLVVPTLVVSPALAEVKPGALFTSGVVLQRECEVPVWGSAAPQEQVEVKFGDTTLKAQADAKGKWIVKLPPQKAGGPHKLIIGAAGSDAKQEIADVYFGEVWIASGQSNMHWTFSHNIKDKEQTLSEANDPLLRQFTVKKGQAKEPAADVAGQWLGASRENLLVDKQDGASAVGYYFGRELRKELNVPVGIINSSVGGTPIELWSPKGGLYNNMIVPMGPLAVRGALWYQGESNVFSKSGMRYVDLQKKMVAAWRESFGKDMAFYFVQIAPFNYNGRPNSKLTADALPEFWQAQTEAAKQVPHSGMVVISDLVENVKDIHPSDKANVGKRLAALALAGDYGRKDVTVSGPTFKEAVADGAALRVRFENVGAGLASRNKEPLSHFQLAGEDRKFHPAEATIEGDSITLRSAKVAKPVAVRFAWDELAMPNLMNKAGWPAGSFRSDDWKLEEEAAVKPAATKEAPAASK